MKNTLEQRNYGDVNHYVFFCFQSFTLIFKLKILNAEACYIIMSQDEAKTFLHILDKVQYASSLFKFLHKNFVFQVITNDFFIIVRQITIYLKILNTFHNSIVFNIFNSWPTID